MRAWTWHTPYSTPHSTPCKLDGSEVLLHSLKDIQHLRKSIQWSLRYSCFSGGGLFVTTPHHSGSHFLSSLPINMQLWDLVINTNISLDANTRTSLSSRCLDIHIFSAKHMPH